MSTPQLVAAGLNADAIARAVRTGWLTRVLGGRGDTSLREAVADLLEESEPRVGDRSRVVDRALDAPALVHVGRDERRLLD